MQNLNRQVLLRSRPKGEPKVSDPSRARARSLAARRMNEGKSYLGMANPVRRSPVGTFALGFNGIRKVDPRQAPVSTALGVLGMPGMTAYVGLPDIGRPKPGV